MSVRRLAPDHVQPGSFAFDAANENWADQQIAKYPAGRQASAVIPLLWKAQEQHHGWVPRAAIEAVARKLDMAPMRVMEIATFYTMFNLQPVGEHFIQLCGTTPCALRGAEAIRKVCEDVIGPQSTVSADGKLSWLEVECLGACCNAPMVQVNFDYYEDLTPDNFRALLDDLRHGRPTKPGPQVDRSCSEPLGGGETLKDPALYDGSVIGAGDWQKRIGEQRKGQSPAPMVQVNFDYYEDLTPDNFRALLDDLRHGRPTKPGPQVDRSCSEPLGGGETLKDPALYDGSVIGAGDWQKRIGEQRKAAAEAAAAKVAAEAVAKAAEATPAMVEAKPAGETAAASRPVPSAPAQPSGASQDTPAANGKVGPATVVASANPVGTTAPVAESKPELLTAARNNAPDDLSLIWGVGPKLAKMLNEMGVWHFDQIAVWTAEELAWVDARLTGFKGRATRDDWISQAKKLSTGWRPEAALGDKPVK